MTENEHQQQNGMAISSLVLGILGVVLNLIPIIPYLLGILAIIFGVSGNKMQNGKGMAVAGIVLGCITLGMKVFFWIFIILLGGSGY
ncbi:DUF4190 domain-containing protein [Saccharococcus sp. Marseille-Q5394]|uniref:DUF4190 domain-containing protein n=1 Tax=Saccharococcus sp. Marseille-Q5394 TaxID=2972778 RepID=UPI0021C5DBD2|nr:DUF4190 domain-containing protein [Saccharococcus sp. Marseille-Q5394]